MDRELFLHNSLAIRKPDSTEDRHIWSQLHIKIIFSDQTSSCWSGQEIWRRGWQAQMFSLSSDHGSKLRGPSQNSLHVASKRSVNIIKLLLFEIEGIGRIIASS
ncbi:hypothetical protein AVEN_157106-1 [Araneus ventricosus]|uniref:Uncharacterized protein n=1 Tax=Araneus ventricosus TaxID=182803 RepID=A0A4Y2HHJ2_ARAVE|nr:hypothetical protein AVEN_157106-1 [Araneus ventricosus]